jgi:membrane fusion protein (multidrug efflux system)
MKDILLLVCLVLLLVLSCSKAPPVISPPNVKVFEIQEGSVPIYRQYVGQIFGFKDIDIRARVEGYLEGIHFDEGSRINKGAHLYTLESQSFEENVAARQSQVAEAKTMLAKTESDLNRIRPLAEENAVSQSDLDSAVANYEASVESVKAAEAILRASEIQLGYTKINSPVDGVIGKTKAKVGDFVGREPNPVILNTVSSIDTVLVRFFITETEYLRFIRKYLAEREAESKETRKAELKLILADDSVYSHKGKVDFIDRQVDPATGAMLVQASFVNPDELLRPGQFARIRAKVKVLKNGILVPQRCVMELQGTYSVYVVDDTNKIHQRTVKADQKIGRFWLIRDGLKSGEKIVYEGLTKVKDGSTVNRQDANVKIPDLESM